MGIRERYYSSLSWPLVLRNAPFCIFKARLVLYANDGRRVENNRVLRDFRSKKRPKYARNSYPRPFFPLSFSEIKMHWAKSATEKESTLFQKLQAQSENALEVASAIWNSLQFKLDRARSTTEARIVFWHGNFRGRGEITFRSRRFSLFLSFFPNRENGRSFNFKPAKKPREERSSKMSENGNAFGKFCTQLERLRVTFSARTKNVRQKKRIFSSARQLRTVTSRKQSWEE